MGEPKKYLEMINGILENFENRSRLFSGDEIAFMIDLLKREKEEIEGIENHIPRVN